MNLTPYDYFLAAFKSVIGSTPRGTQAKIATITGKSRVHINDILGGRKSASQDLQASISTALGFTYEEMLSAGRHIIEGDPGFVMEKHEGIPPDILEASRDPRIQKIIRAAVEALK